LFGAASRLSGTVASAFGDKDDKFGGLGRNGAQKMEPREVVQGVDRLLAVEGSYGWQPGCFHNLESSKYILDPKGGDAHGFVTGKEGSMGNRSCDRIAKLDLLIIPQLIAEKNMRDQSAMNEVLKTLSPPR